jgi:membrane associated rhomboid family serine protease
MFPLRDNAPKGAFPVVTIALIASCILVYLWQLTYPGGFEQSLLTWGERPRLIFAGANVPGTDIPAWVTLFTSMFMHGGFMHLLGNMMGLWLFGDNIEWLLGRFRYIIFYIGCGLLASLVTVFLGRESDIPGIGASGAIAGVMAAYVLFYPRAAVTTLVFFGGIHMVNISAMFYIGFWILTQFIGAGALYSSGESVNAGVYAHAAGAAAGFALVYPLLIRARRPGAWEPERHQYDRKVLYR